ncbi:MAG: Fe(3+) ABC transporter substrate-binding protein [Leptothrix sp. (in: Bacteria)]|nr:Fe(3+) ABC transporter substrate-binding protein [Leptothrix sp. (in: b-proteobacteria)]
MAALALSALLAPGAATAQQRELNLYSARHYQTDEALYADFTKATGIRINRVEADDAGILARLKAEGTASPADVILLVDAARLWRGEQEGLFQPVKSAVLDKRVPTHFRGGVAAQGAQWFGLSTRARLVVYDKSRLKAADVDSYEKLAAPALKGQFCVRSGSHPYNLSLFGSMVEHLGAPATETWLKGLVANMARPPKGGDTDQIKGVASGECGVALSNSYYYARLLRSAKPEDRALAEKVGVIFPNQDSWGTHVNIAGGAVARNAKNRDAAVAFLEYLTSDSAQRYFADGNNEYPIVPTVPVNDALASLGRFKAETVPIAKVGANTALVQQMLDRAGFK